MNDTFKDFSTVGAILITIFMFLTFGCGVSADKEDESKVVAPTESADTIFGSVTMGPVKKALVKAYKLNDDGSLGAEVASGLSDDKGEYTLTLKEQYNGAMEIISTGGSYVDEATGDTVERGEEEQIRTMLQERSREHIGINALTTMAASQARQNINGGLATALENANKNIAALFGLDGVDFVKTKPHDLTSSSEAVDESSSASKIGLAMAAVSQMAKDNNLEPQKLGELVKNMARDYADGSMDGNLGGEKIEGALPAEPEKFIERLSDSYQNFSRSERNLAGFSAEKAPSAEQIGEAVQRRVQAQVQSGAQTQTQIQR
jgi:lysozyme family protein